MNRTWQRLVAATACLLGVAAVRAGEEDKLPPKVIETVKAAYPDARITETENERHRGVMLYEVELRVGGKEIELKIDETGVIGSVTTELRVKDAPAAVVDACKKSHPDGKIKEVEQREVRAAFLFTGFAPLRETCIVYEVEVKTKDGEAEILLDATGKVLRAKMDDDDDDDDDEGEHEDDD